MSADFNKPVTTDLYAATLSEIRDLIAELAKALDATTALNIPTGAVGFSSANSRWEKFNGTTWAALAAVYAIAISGNAGTASALQTARNIGITGDMTGTVSFDGTANVAIAGTLATVNANVGSFGSGTLIPVITVNAKGLVTAVSTTALTPAWANITGKPTTVAASGLADAISTGNIGTYAPTLIGGGASGTWGISISGNAATVSNGMYLTAITQTTTAGNVSRFRQNGTAGIASIGVDKAGLSAFSDTTGPAIISFNRTATPYGIYLGLDTDNVLKIGGWSFGASAATLIHSSNYNTYAPTLTGTGASGTWGINISGNAATATAATSATSATTATHLAGGGGGQIPYQSATGTTAMLAAGTAGYVLTSGGTGAPSWASQASLSVGTATNASNLTSGGTIASSVTATTQSAGTNNTTVATTAYADRAASAVGVKAWGYFTVTAGVVTVQASSGVTSVVRNSAGNFTVTLSAAPNGTSNWAPVVNSYGNTYQYMTGAKPTGNTTFDIRTQYPASISGVETATDQEYYVFHVYG